MTLAPTTGPKSSVIVPLTLLVCAMSETLIMSSVKQVNSLLFMLHDFSVINISITDVIFISC